MNVGTNWQVYNYSSFSKLCCDTAYHKSILLKYSLSTCGTVVKKDNWTDENIMIRQVLSLLQVN